MIGWNKKNSVINKREIVEFWNSEEKWNIKILTIDETKNRNILSIKAKVINSKSCWG